MYYTLFQVNENQPDQYLADLTIENNRVAMDTLSNMALSFKNNFKNDDGKNSISMVYCRRDSIYHELNGKVTHVLVRQ